MERPQDSQRTRLRWRCESNLHQVTPLNTSCASGSLSAISSMFSRVPKRSNRAVLVGSFSITFITSDSFNACNPRRSVLISLGDSSTLSCVRLSSLSSSTAIQCFSSVVAGITCPASLMKAEFFVLWVCCPVLPQGLIADGVSSFTCGTFRASGEVRIRDPAVSRGPKIGCRSVLLLVRCLWSISLLGVAIHRVRMAMPMNSLGPRYASGIVRLRALRNSSWTRDVLIRGCRWLGRNRMLLASPCSGACSLSLSFG